MELLPPVGWADVATKEDLRQLEERLNLRLDSKLNELRADFLRTMNSRFRNLVVLCSTLVFAVAGLAFAAARIH